MKGSRKTYNFRLVEAEWLNIMKYYQIATRYDPAVTTNQKIWNRSGKIKQLKGEMALLQAL